MVGLVAATLSAMLSTGCALTRHQSDSPPTENSPPAAQPPETEAQKLTRLEGQLDSMSTRLASLEVRVNTLAAREAAARKKAEELAEARKPRPEIISGSPADRAGSPILSAGAAARAGFTSDDALQQFREGMILFESRNYPDAVLAFSSFIDHYPDHPLAGSAQYYLGEAYFKQNEFKLASREFQRVLTSYDRSVHVADTLRDLAASEDKLQDPEDARRHREMLGSIFASSPAAAALAQAGEPGDGSAPQPFQNAPAPGAGTGTTAPERGATTGMDQPSPDSQAQPQQPEAPVSAPSPAAAPSPEAAPPSTQSRYDVPPDTAPGFSAQNTDSSGTAAQP